MSTSSGIYVADDIRWVVPSTPDTNHVKRKFKATVSTMLAQTGATKFLTGDVILLCPIPPQVILSGYRIYLPIIDSDGSPTATWDVGDTQVLSGAVTGIVSTQVTLPAVGTTFTLTASASTASFTATNGLLLVDGLFVIYESLSGSTFVNCRTTATNRVIPRYAGIQQCGNLAAYQTSILTGQTNAGVVTDTYAQSVANTFLNSTITAGAMPAVMPKAYNTMALWGRETGPTWGNLSPFYLTLYATADVATQGSTAGIISGWISYDVQGW